MNKEKLSKKLFEELSAMTTGTDRRRLMSSLKEKALHVDLDKREDFENALLDYAKKIKKSEIRRMIYEVMASLSSTWEYGKPEKSLSDSFWDFYNADKYSEAQKVCSDLIKQGLDYIGEAEMGAGKFFPVTNDNHKFIVQYDEKYMRFLNLDLKEISVFDMQPGKSIIDILPPQVQFQRTDKESNIWKKLWLLVSAGNGDKEIISFDLSKNKFEGETLPVPETCSDVRDISLFKECLLLLSQKTIYYYDYEGKSGWHEWFTAESDITCSEPREHGLWIGLANGNILILRLPGRPGARDKIKSDHHMGSIIDICHGELFTVVSSEKFLNIIDAGRTSIAKKIGTKSKVLQTMILDDDFIACMQINGFLVGREINYDHTRWELNFGHIYDSVFRIDSNLYLCTSPGHIDRLKMPRIQAMSNALENQHIRLPGKPVEREPAAPVRHMIEFIRQERPFARD